MSLNIGNIENLFESIILFEFLKQGKELLHIVKKKLFIFKKKT